MAARTMAPPATAAVRTGRRRGSGVRKAEPRIALAMLSPALAVILLVALLPVLYSIYLSLRTATIADSGDWAGLGNYLDVLADPEFHTAFTNTAVFTVVSVALEFGLGLAMALALHRMLRLRGVMRAAMLIPWAFPVAISAMLWRLMLQDQIGIVARIVHGIGLSDQPILSDHTSLMVAAIGVDVWKTTPFVTLLLLAGLQTVPRELIEAATVDGATAVQRFFAVTLPHLKPVVLVALLFRTLESWSVYDLFWVMTDRQLTSLSTYVFKGVKVSQLQFANGNAAAVLIFASSIIIALLYLRIFRTRDARTGG
ncbi:carbohydrate ABC transporter permease [Streptomyces winkii]|uniref:carbohydrate ABC transporter permease n=1 Tax=Streptomyces winkii TaxID=3051178 RepID=UPI0028D5BBC1|nr:sugar ABC transporter permease [Streptomyces sp. DSM 40971]